MSIWTPLFEAADFNVHDPSDSYMLPQISWCASYLYATKRDANKQGGRQARKPEQGETI